mgnify:CR=1 FL=1
MADQTTDATAHEMTFAHEAGASVLVTQATAHEMTFAHEMGAVTIAAYDADAVPTKACYPDGSHRAGPLKGVGAGLENGDYRDVIALRKSGNYTGDLLMACTSITSASISGYGAISHVVLHVAARVITAGGTGTLSTPVFVLPGRTVAMTTSPLIGAAVEFTECVSANLTTHDGANAWTWDNIFTALTGLAATVSVAFTGTYIEAQVAMFWVEVFGPLGAPRRKLTFEYAIAPIRRTLVSRLTI